MKKVSIVLLSSLLLISGLSVFGFSNVDNINTYTPTSAATLPKNINLNSVSESAIRVYYSGLSSLQEGELKGTNLLKNLKPILNNNFVYYSYAQVFNIYEITDRNWTLSPASSTTYGTYDETTNTISNYEYYSTLSDKKNNPYVHLLYLNDNDNPDTALKIQDSHTFNNTTVDAINREHCWPQSYGFKSPDTGTNAARGPAGTDLHHLIAADGQVNSIAHNNYTYGNVTTNDSEWQSKVTARARVAGNKRGKSIVTHQEGLGNETFVFEPQDSDKGDIARALFYMVAKYNNLAGSTGAISEYEPNLALDNLIYKADQESFYSSDTVAATYGQLDVLLQWNKIDPPDEYEIHRNDLIYNNYQFNRNPFIDFPQWADYIWGENVEDKCAIPASDTIYKPTSSPEEDPPVYKYLEYITVDKEPNRISYEQGDYISLYGAVITAHYSDGTTENVTYDVTCDVDELTEVGIQEVTLSFTYDGVEKTTTLLIYVNKKKMDFTRFIYLGAGIVVAAASLFLSFYLQHRKKNPNKKKK